MAPPSPIPLGDIRPRPLTSDTPIHAGNPGYGLQNDRGRAPGREPDSRLGALTDPVVRDTMALTEPSRAWTTQSLVGSVAVSRAT
ncbi:hypothetical protein [Streptomyces sp. NPDC088141]|uniref:hypothetical protein n=1 Tax=Streptomyces sp. NPDC088141 TaxID=3155179 RepID=UPI00343842F7